MYRRPSLLSDISSLAHSGRESVPSLGEWGASPMDAIFAPRPLSPDEVTELQPLLKSTLKLTNCSCVLQAEEDATDLLTYAFDLISDGETVGDILEELMFMELEICGLASVDEMRACLATFLGNLDGVNQEGAISGRSQSMPLPQDEAGLDPQAATQTCVRRNSLASQMRRADNHVSVDLSCKTAATKKQEEMEQLFGRGTRPSIKARMSMYDDQGRLRGSFQNNDGPDDLADVDDLGFEMKDQASIDAQRREELMMVMNNRSLTKNEKDKKLGEVRAKYGLAEMKMKVAQATNAASVSKEDGRDKNGVASNKIVIQRAEKEMRGGRRSSVDLSAKSATAKRERELASLFGKSSLKDRMSMYDEQGNIDAKKDEEQVKEVNDIVKEKSLDQMRREELTVVMKDKTLKREEKAQRMEDIKQKYSAMAAEKTQPQDTVKKTAKQAPGQTSAEISYMPRRAQRKNPQGGGKSHSKTKSCQQANQEGSAYFDHANMEGEEKKSSSEEEEKNIAEDVDNDEYIKFLALINSQDANKQERDELQTIVRDKTLNTRERKKEMERVRDEMERVRIELQRVRGHYAMLSKGRQDNRSASMSSKLTADIDLSAKSSALRRRNSLEKLQKGRVMSLHERKIKYNNFISAVQLD